MAVNRYSSCHVFSGGLHSRWVCGFSLRRHDRLLVTMTSVVISQCTLQYRNNKWLIDFYNTIFFYYSRRQTAAKVT